MRTYLSKSLQRKLTGALMAAVVLATVLSAAAAAWRETGHHFRAKREAVLAIASTLAAAIAPAVEQGQRAEIGSRLNAIREMPSIRFAGVVDAEGRRLHEIGSGIVIGTRTGWPLPNQEIGAFTSLRLGTYLASRPVISAGRTVGHVTVIADLSELRHALIDSILSALAAGAVVAAMAMLAASRITRAVTQPISALTDAINTIRSCGDYTQTVPRTTADETGRLVDHFNAMMREISGRDEALRRHRDKLADEVLERTRELTVAKEEAERANAAKSEFLAVVSHEIRTPLNGMLVTAELLASEELSPHARRHCEVMVKSGGHLLALVNDVLDLSKIEAGELVLERSPFNPAALVEDVVLLFRPRAAAAGLAMACRIGPGVPRRIMGDELRLRQILSNLLSNALKFTEQGSVTVEVDVATGGSGQPQLRLGVRDTGIGIPQNRIAAIFDAFTQAEASTTRRYGGTGIGLTICRRLAAAMSGEIAVVSEVGRGSTFTLALPLEPAEASDAAFSQDLPRPALVVPSASRTGFAGSRVLAVDDNPLNLEVLAAALGRFGIHAHCVDSGARAIEACRLDRFDLVFMDGSMPDLDGFEATRRIRSQEKETGRPPVPIVALTAHVVGTHAHTWRDAGASDCMTKPYTLDEIRECLGRWLKPQAPAVGGHAAPVAAAIGRRGADRGCAAPILDAAVLASIRELEGGGGELLQRVIRLYVQHAPRLLADLRGLEPRECSAVARSAHALKSLCRNVGAIRAGDACEAIEGAAQSGVPPAPRELIELAEALDATIAALNAELGAAA